MLKSVEEESVQCSFCVHCKSNEFVCVAFPEGVPEDILSGEFRHTKRHPKQKNDTVYKQAK